MRNKNKSKKFERRRRLESKGFLKSKKFKLLIVFILCTFISAIVTVLIKYLNYNWDKVTDINMGVCERINQDMMALPYLSIAVKEKMINSAFFDE